LSPSLFDKFIQGQCDIGSKPHEFIKSDPLPDFKGFDLAEMEQPGQFDVRFLFLPKFIIQIKGIWGETYGKRIGDCEDGPDLGHEVINRFLKSWMVHFVDGGGLKRNFEGGQEIFNDFVFIDQIKTFPLTVFYHKLRNENRVKMILKEGGQLLN
jgi:hypothetical protein